MARCPHCRKVSSVGPEFARGRGVLFLVLGVIFLLIGLGTTFGTFKYAQVFKIIIIDELVILVFN